MANPEVNKTKDGPDKDDVIPLYYDPAGSSEAQPRPILVRRSQVPAVLAAVRQVSQTSRTETK